MDRRFEPWPQRRHPHPDEALDSLVCRVADAHRMKPSDLVRLTELTKSSGTRPNGGTVAWMHSPEPEGVTNLAHALDLTDADVWQTTLHRYDWLLPELAKLDYRVANDARKITLRDFAVFDTTRYCPRCLAQCGYWPLAWRLGWKYACVEHGCWLTSRCSTCKRQVRGAVPISTFACSAPLGVVNHRTERCLHDLRTAAPVPVADDRLLKLQARTDTQLSVAATGDALLHEVFTAVQTVVCNWDDFRNDGNDDHWQWARSHVSRGKAYTATPRSGDITGTFLTAALDHGLTTV